MSLPSDRWLADLIETHVDDLATRMTSHAQQTSQAHQALDDAEVHSGFVAFYRALAAEISTGDPAHMRSHLQRVLPVRVQAGAQVEDLVRMVDALEEPVVDLLTGADAADHEHVAAARPRLEAIRENIRAQVRQIAG